MLVHDLVVVAHIHMRGLNTEVEKGSREQELFASQFLFSPCVGDVGFFFLLKAEGMQAS